MRIKGFIKNTFIEYPGKIASIIFLQGCNFRCPFCFNPEMIPETEGEVNEQEVLDFLKSQGKWIDALVISGGEPTIQEDLLDFITKVKELGMLVRIYTNGSRPDVLRKLIDGKLVDSVAMDIKTNPTDERYDAVTKTKSMSRNVRESVSIIMNSGIDYEFRTTVVPKIITDEDISGIASAITGAKKFVLQRFLPENTLDPSLLCVETQTDAEMERLSNIAKDKVETLWR